MLCSHSIRFDISIGAVLECFGECSVRKRDIHANVIPILGGAPGTNIRSKPTPPNSGGGGRFRNVHATTALTFFGGVGSKRHLCYK